MEMIDEQKQRGYMLKLPPELPVEMYGWLYDGLFIFTVEVAENAWVDAILTKPRLWTMSPMDIEMAAWRELPQRTEGLLEAVDYGRSLKALTIEFHFAFSGAFTEELCDVLKGIKCKGKVIVRIGTQADKAALINDDLVELAQAMGWGVVPLLGNSDNDDEEDDDDEESDEDGEDEED